MGRAPLLRPPVVPEDEFASSDSFYDQTIPEPNSGCLLWTGRVDKDGYGIIIRGDKGHTRHRRASHIALELSGRPRPGRLYALHHCDVPGCVNAEHLYWGTQTDNNNDSIKRGRWGVRLPPVGIGSDHYLAKLTPEHIRDIRRLIVRGKSQAYIAFLFQVSRGTICDIALGKTWRHVR